MARKSPHSLTAKLGRTAPACLWPDRSVPDPVPCPIGSRARTRRYRSRILAASSRSAANQLGDRRAFLCMNGLFMTNSCCSDDVVRSRSGAGLHRIGEIVDAAAGCSGGRGSRGRTRCGVRSAPNRHPRRVRTSCRPASPRRAEACRDNDSISSRRGFMRQNRLLIWSTFAASGRGAARLPVRGRKHDLAIEPLQRPAVGDETRRQIVQQFRMRWLLALHAEIAGRGDQRPAEMPAPHAIHDHPRGQWRGVGEDSVRQIQPSRAVLERRSRPARVRPGNAAAPARPAWPRCRAATRENRALRPACN